MFPQTPSCYVKDPYLPYVYIYVYSNWNIPELFLVELILSSLS